jgi:hypothetical protein
VVYSDSLSLLKPTKKNRPPPQKPAGCPGGVSFQNTRISRATLRRKSPRRLPCPYQHHALGGPERMLLFGRVPQLPHQVAETMVIGELTTNPIPDLRKKRTRVANLKPPHLPRHSHFARHTNSLAITNPRKHPLSSRCVAKRTHLDRQPQRFTRCARRD